MNRVAKLCCQCYYLLLLPWNLHRHAHVINIPLANPDAVKRANLQHFANLAIGHRRLLWRSLALCGHDISSFDVSLLADPKRDKLNY
jgi:hypothetical protein